MNPLRKVTFVAIATLSLTTLPVLAQVPDGPQASPPPSVVQPEKPAVHKLPQTPDPINAPAGTRFAVVLENGISTRGAKPGDSLYFRTSFPITQNNRVVIPSAAISAVSSSSPSAPAASKVTVSSA